MADEDLVRIHHADGFATVTLANPARRNALSREMIDALSRALAEVGHTDARGVVLAAEGPVFSAGHDFADMAGADEEANRDLFVRCTALMLLTQQIPQPVVARVHGLATAAGCQLVASCDLAVAAESAGFALPGGKGGFFCHTPLVAVARTIGRKRALEMAFTGDVISPQTALAWGLVNRVVPDDDLDGAVLDLLQRSTRGSAASKAMGKRGFYEQVDQPDEAAYELAVAVMTAAAGTADAQEGMAAFLEKRPPRFTS